MLKFIDNYEKDIREKKKEDEEDKEIEELMEL